MLLPLLPLPVRSLKRSWLNVIDLSFSLAQNIGFTVGDYIEVYGERYTLKNLMDVNKISRKEFEYTVQFKSRAYDLKSRQYWGLDSSNKLTKGVFSITGKASAMIDLLVLNANRGNSGWVKGVVDDTAEDTITFTNGDNCLSVLSIIADKVKMNGG